MSNFSDTRRKQLTLRHSTRRLRAVDENSLVADDRDADNLGFDRNSLDLDRRGSTNLFREADEYSLRRSGLLEDFPTCSRMGRILTVSMTTMSVFSWYISWSNVCLR